MGDHGNTTTDPRVSPCSIRLERLEEQKIKSGSDKVKGEMEKNTANPVNLEEITDESETSMSELVTI